MKEFLRKYWWAIILWVAPIIIIGITCQNWQLLVAIATWFLAGGIFVAIWQIIVTRENARKGTNAQLAVELSRELSSEEVRNTLRDIYRLPESVQNLRSCGKNDSEIHDIDSVLHRFNLLGALVSQGIFDERLAIEAYGGVPVLKCWYQLREYIRRERDRRSSLFCKYMEDFAWRTWEYQRNRPQEEHIRFYPEPVGEPVDLVRWLNEHPDKGPNKRT